MMHATVEGQRWRLRFRHIQTAKGRKRGRTYCFVEQWQNGPAQGWVEVAQEVTICGRSDTFRKEQGRQFALVRALRLTEVPRAVKSALVTAYLKSGDREMCDDLWTKGHRNLYEAVFGAGEI